jgi:HTH-type transcriptional regulator, sugar sensing transcriptional regulator
MLASELITLGLSGKEAKVYLAVLELGEANIQKIAQKSGIKRTTVYDIIASLKEKRLLTEITKGKKTLFSAEDPRKLEGQLDEKKETLKKILPELLSITNLLDKKPTIKFYEGAEGIKEVYKDTLNYSDQELLAWVTAEAMTGFDIDWLEKYYVKKRLEKKIWVRVIAPDTEDMLKQYISIDEKSLRRTKLVPAPEFPFEVEINLYGKNRIAVMSFAERIGLIIESPKLHRTLKSIFELNWKYLPEYAKMTQY